MFILCLSSNSESPICSKVKHLRWSSMANCLPANGSLSSADTLSLQTTEDLKIETFEF